MTFCSPIQIRGKNNHWQMHKYYRSYAMEHKLQDYHRSGWSVAKKWHPSIVVSHHQSWSWCEKIGIALFIRSSKAISLWVLLTKSSICTYFIICVCQLQQTNRQKGQGKPIFFSKSDRLPIVQKEALKRNPHLESELWTCSFIFRQRRLLM